MKTNRQQGADENEDLDDLIEDGAEAEPAGDAEPAGEPITTDDLEVDLSEPIDLGDGKPVPGTTPEKKKPNRYKELKQQNRDLQRRLDEMSGQMTGLAQRPPQVIQQQQSGQQTDPLERQLEGLEDQRQGLLTQLSAQGLAKEDGDRLMRQYRKVEREIRQVDVAIGARSLGLRPAQQQDPQAVERQILASEFPQVFSDPVLNRMAEAEMMRLVTRLKKPMGIVTAREAARNVMRSEGLLRPEPSSSERAKLTSVSSRPGGGGAGDQKFKPSRLQLNMARAYTQHLPDMKDSDRVKKWVKEVGRPNGLV